jgi:hypothetical protein
LSFQLLFSCKEDCIVESEHEAQEGQDEEDPEDNLALIALDKFCI